MNLSCTHPRTHAHMHARMHTHTHVHSYAHMHMHMHTHTHVHTHTHTHTHTILRSTVIMSVKADHFPIQVRDSIILRPYTTNDADVVFSAVNENREHLGCWFPWVEATKTVKDSQDFLDSIVKEEHTNCTGIHLGIFHINSTKSGEDKLLGAVAIRKINLSDRTGEIGCWLSSDCQGKGLATMACLKIIEYGEKAIGIDRFELHTAVDNHHTQALAERLGFTRVPGEIEAAEIVNSKPVNHVVYVLGAKSIKTVKD